jgi:hypothetical protein
LRGGMLQMGDTRLAMQVGRREWKNRWNQIRERNVG